ncbi:hypothetical protein RRG08_067055 [Elysia crispata]|uniref:Uncharacterized protein n=1 Tax=Elysia crispata TaxID=231223 RepID=A0AAE1B9S4_9GAST|nr:hypothetical protein RRG08_067055 [Elysia crispata]
MEIRSNPGFHCFCLSTARAKTRYHDVLITLELTLLLDRIFVISITARGRQVKHRLYDSLVCSSSCASHLVPLFTGCRERQHGSSRPLLRQRWQSPRLIGSPWPGLAREVTLFQQADGGPSMLEHRADTAALVCSRDKSECV